MNSLLVVIAFATTIGLAVTLAPRILERLLVHQLNRAGIEAPSLRIARLSPRHLQIKDLRLEHDRRIGVRRHIPCRAVRIHVPHPMRYKKIDGR